MKQYVTTIDGNSVYYHPKRNTVTVETSDKRIVEAAKGICKMYEKKRKKTGKKLEKLLSSIEKSKKEQEKSNDKNDNHTHGFDPTWWNQFRDKETGWYGMPLNSPTRKTIAKIVANYYDPLRTTIYEDVDQYKDAMENHNEDVMIHAFLKRLPAQSVDGSIQDRHLYIKPKSFSLWGVYDADSERDAINTLKELGLLELTKSGSPIRKFAGTRHYCINCNKIEEFVVKGMMGIYDVHSLYASTPSECAIGLSLILDNAWYTDNTIQITEDIDIYREKLNSTGFSEKTPPKLMYYDRNTYLYSMDFALLQHIMCQYIRPLPKSTNILSFLSTKLSDGSTVLRHCDDFDGMPHVGIDLIRLLVLPQILEQSFHDIPTCKKSN